MVSFEEVEQKCSFVHVLQLATGHWVEYGKLIVAKLKNGFSFNSMHIFIQCNGYFQSIQ